MQRIFHNGDSLIHIHADLTSLSADFVNLNTDGAVIADSMFSKKLMSDQEASCWRLFSLELVEDVIFMRRVIAFVMLHQTEQSIVQLGILTFESYLHIKWKTITLRSRAIRNYTSCFVADGPSILLESLDMICLLRRSEEEFQTSTQRWTQLIIERGSKEMGNICFFGCLFGDPEMIQILVSSKESSSTEDGGILYQSTSIFHRDEKADWKQFSLSPRIGGVVTYDKSNPIVFIVPQIPKAERYHTDGLEFEDGPFGASFYAVQRNSHILEVVYGKIENVIPTNWNINQLSLAVCFNNTQLILKTGKNRFVIYDGNRRQLSQEYRDITCISESGPTSTFYGPYLIRTEESLNGAISLQTMLGMQESEPSISLVAESLQSRVEHTIQELKKAQEKILIKEALIFRCLDSLNGKSCETVPTQAGDVFLNGMSTLYPTSASTATLAKGQNSSNGKTAMEVGLSTDKDTSIILLRHRSNYNGSSLSLALTLESREALYDFVVFAFVDLKPISMKSSMIRHLSPGSSVEVVLEGDVKYQHEPLLVSLLCIHQKDSAKEQFIEDPRGNISAKVIAVVGIDLSACLKQPRTIHYKSCSLGTRVSLFHERQEYEPNVRSIYGIQGLRSKVFDHEQMQTVTIEGEVHNQVGLELNGVINSCPLRKDLEVFASCPDALIIFLERMSQNLPDGMHMTASMLSEKVLSVLQDAHEKVREEIRALIDILTKSCQEGLPSTNFDASYHTRSQLLDKLLTAQIETDVFISAVNAVGNFGLFEAFSVN